MSANSEVIDRFIAAWKTKDVDHIVGFFHDDAVYTNVPIDPPNRGIEEEAHDVIGVPGLPGGDEAVDEFGVGAHGGLLRVYCCGWRA